MTVLTKTGLRCHKCDRHILARTLTICGGCKKDEKECTCNVLPPIVYGGKK